MKETILIIEDEKDILALLSSMLKSEGYSIITASNGREGLEKFQEFNPDLIGIRTLSIYREFFHNAISIIRAWGYKNPIAAGGPYATSDYVHMLRDGNIDFAVIGEGEITFGEIITKMIENDKKLPDEEILKVGKELDSANINWSGRYIFHCSGLLSSEVLKPFSAKGASVASIHPIQSFAHKKSPPEQFENIYFGLEGEIKALKMSQEIIQRVNRCFG